MSKINDIKIRKARKVDIPVLIGFLVDLGVHVSGTRRKTLSRKAKKHLRDILSDYIDDNDKFMVVACTPDNDVVGMGNIQIWHNPNLWEEAEDAEEADQKSGFIDDLWVEPECRNRGIMGRILAELVDFAESHDIDELILEYALTNKEAAAVWRRLGFTPTGVRAAASTKTVRKKLLSA